MRIIAGTFRSRTLVAPPGMSTRPTSDRLRETLFNILGPSVKDSLFVDLCAGTGAIGIEAISRGARETIFIESHPAGVQLVRQNLEALGIRSGVDVIEADVVKGLKNLAARHLVADFIFLDPPYAKVPEHIGVLEYLDASHLIAPRGLVIVEHHWRVKLPERLERLERTREIEQGESMLSFYQLAAAA